MRAIGASVLVFEAIVVGLAIPVALTLTDVDRHVAVWGGLALCAACLVVAGLLRQRTGYLLGTLLQVLVVACGFVVTAMFVIGGLFALLWVTGFLVVRRADRVNAERAPASPIDGGTAFGG